MNLEWKWRQFEASTPPGGVRLILKMAEPDGSISYAIGMIDRRTNELTFTAQENEKATMAVLWMMIPD